MGRKESHGLEFYTFISTDVTLFRRQAVGKAKGTVTGGGQSSLLAEGRERREAPGVDQSGNGRKEAAARSL